MVDFVKRIGKENVGGKIYDLYFELNKWSFESKLNDQFNIFPKMLVMKNAGNTQFNRFN